jgi:hypothetical protein
MNTIGCPVCSKPLSVTVARGRKSFKPFIMLKCPTDGRHFRGFITDQAYVKRILNQTVMGPGGVQSERQTA